MIAGEKQRRNRGLFMKRKDAPVCPCTPLCGVLFRRWRDCSMRTKSGNFAQIQLSPFAKMRGLSRIGTAKNDCSPAIFVNIILTKK